MKCPNCGKTGIKKDPNYGHLLEKLPPIKSSDALVEAISHNMWKSHHCEVEK